MIYGTNSIPSDLFNTIGYLTNEESDSLRDIEYIPLKENSRLNKNLVRFAEAVKYMNDTSSSLLEFIHKISESNNIPVDSIAFSALPSDLADDDNNSLIIEMKRLNIPVYPETHDTTELDSVVEYCIENETVKPLLEIYDAVDRGYKRFDKSFRKGFAKNIGYGAAYVGSQALAGAKAGAASFLSKKGTDAVTGVMIPKKLRDKYNEFGAEFKTDSKGNKKIISKNAARQFSDSVLGGMKNQITGNVKSTVSDLLGVETKGGIAYNKPGMLNLVTSKMHKVENQMTGEADPQKKSFLRRVLELLAKIRDKILNAIRGKQQQPSQYPT